MEQSELIDRLDEHERHYLQYKNGKEEWPRPPFLEDIDASNMTLDGGFFRDVPLYGMKATNASVTDVIFENANAQYSILDYANGDRGNFHLTQLDAGSLFSMSAVDADFSRAKATYADFSMSKLDNADFRDADLSHASFTGASLRYANVDGADLSGADLRFADLTGVDLSQAKSLQGAKIDLNNIDSDMLDKMVRNHSIVPETGEFTGHKWVRDSSTGNDYVMNLTIPENAQRVGGLAGSVCRADEVRIDSITDYEGNQVSGPIMDSTEGVSFHPGDKVTTDNFETDPTQANSGGIKFHKTSGEAFEYARMLDESFNLPRAESLKVNDKPGFENNNLEDSEINSSSMPN